MKKDKVGDPIIEWVIGFLGLGVLLVGAFFVGTYDWGGGRAAKRQDASDVMDAVEIMIDAFVDDNR